MTSSSSNSRPVLAVGLMSAPEIELNFISGFDSLGPKRISIGELTGPLRFDPVAPDSVFELGGVTIGVGFHWQQRQSQRFRGAVELLPDNGVIVVINHIDVENYLCSVISSEMSATSPIEFLKAHAVISRSWLLRMIGRRASECVAAPGMVADGEIVRWYDREDHTLFDVCADDHCQRYQGVTRLTTDMALQAVKATEGMVLTCADGTLCDARFSKCCGGATEVFGTCWGEEHHPYLQAFRDTLPQQPLPDLTTEAGARQWITSRPESFCNTSDPALLGKVLNNFDRTTTDFYRWEVTATSEELAETIRSKSGIDFGDIVDLTPLDRGPSGRLYRLKITGTKRTLIVGKELEIRRLLSPTHLYSSAFIVEKTEKIGDGDKKITTFTLRGAGWGHGVGLCQIGAAAMSEAGYGFKQILAHYYPDTTVTKAYE
ncbi:MAG: SpoIID/LytB domain-containing protein [Bacteroidales bacterium]|nr:SpoIID/LytB domain-containing protein [Bacteroidales bacterium]